MLEKFPFLIEDQIIKILSENTKKYWNECIAFIIFDVIFLQESSTTNNATPQPLAETSKTQNSPADQDTTAQETTSAVIGKPELWWINITYKTIQFLIRKQIFCLLYY